MQSLKHFFKNQMRMYIFVKINPSRIFFIFIVFFYQKCAKIPLAVKFTKTIENKVAKNMLKKYVRMLLHIW